MVAGLWWLSKMDLDKLNAERRGLDKAGLENEKDGWCRGCRHLADTGKLLAVALFRGRIRRQLAK